MFGRSKDMKEVLALMKAMVKKMPASDPQMAKEMVDNYVNAFLSGKDVGYQMGRAAERSALIEQVETRKSIAVKTYDEPPPPAGYDDLHPGEVSVGRGTVGAPA